jgi:hypothetical protein
VSKARTNVWEKPRTSCFPRPDLLNFQCPPARSGLKVEKCQLTTCCFGRSCCCDLGRVLRLFCYPATAVEADQPLPPTKPDITSSDTGTPTDIDRRRRADERAAAFLRAAAAILWRAQYAQASAGTDERLLISGMRSLFFRRSSAATGAQPLDPLGVLVKCLGPRPSTSRS